jgi:bifunctional non-homologous end joining protein LigD
MAARRGAARVALPGVPPEIQRAIATTGAALEAAILEGAPRASVPIANVAAHAPELLGTGLAARAPLVDATGWSWSAEEALNVSLTNLTKPIGDAVTKGDLLRYYVAVAPYLLRALAGRPLVLRRHTDPVAGAAFYQQHVASPTPAGVDTAVVGDSEKSRFVGGALVTLLYLAQLGAVSMDPWHGRADEPDLVDYAIIDLDPGPHTAFTRVVDVARWVHDELIALGLASVPKTSGATGMHIVVPLPSDTPAEAGRLLAELVATQVVARHAQAATIVRSVRGRASDAVYVDYLQNIAGKTVASVYSARATPTLTVSTPFTWDEVTPALDPRDWTVRSVPARLAQVGDLWGEAMLRGNDLEALRRTLFAAPTTPAGTPSAHGGSQRRRRG